MLFRFVCRAVLRVGVAACLCLSCFASDSSLPRIVVNDNRQPAGTLEKNALTIRLEIREGQLYPEAEDGPHIATEAFAEAGKAPMVPGPLVRVPEGTEIHAIVRNTLPHAMEVHGLFTRPGNDAIIALAAGEDREVRFLAGAPGTYYYFALDPLTTVSRFHDPGGQSQFLAGAFIVDEQGAHPRDRVFLIQLWRKYTDDAGNFDGEFGTINGKSWPYTERFSFPMGSSVEWRVINASAAIHPMHLHGSYFRIDASGNWRKTERFAPDKRQMVVTRNMRVGETMDLNWKPEHPGHWLFHCHIVAHIMPDASLSAVQNLPMRDHGRAGMAGLVLAAEVTGNAHIKPAAYRMARRLTLTLREPVPRERIALELRDGRQRSESTALMGPPIVLHRGEPSEIKIVNHLTEQTAIHWHGMELESPYDGVPDFSGVGKQVTPPIPPGGTFVARMTPPRAGTFIYHTHWHDVDQLDEGLYGPLIVLEPGQELRPQQDIAIVAGLSVKDTDGPLLFNGSERLEIPARAGKVRLRLINITPNNTALLCTLTLNGKTVRWRALAKDGMELPEARKTTGESVQQVGVGETYDYEITAAAGDEFTLEGYLPGPKIRVQALIHVR